MKSNNIRIITLLALAVVLVPLLGKVVVCTSTKIRRPEHLPVYEADREGLTRALSQQRILCVGTPWPGGKLSAPAMGFDALCRAADYVLVEADGAHELPIKAHAPYEPVIPEQANQTILVVGCDCFGQPIARTVHRPERFCALCGAGPQTLLTPELAARVILAEGLGDRVYLNKAETPPRLQAAEIIAGLLPCPVAAGSLLLEEYQCLC